MMSRPAVPELRIGEIDADHLARGPPATSNRRRATGRGSGGTKSAPLLLVPRVHRQREQLAVRVRVHVTGRADEVRDVRPPREVAVGELDRVAEHRALRLLPQLAESLDRELPFLAPRGVHRVLEAVHRDLTEHRRDLIFEVRREQRQPFRGIGHRLEQAAEGDGLAEHRRGLRERQRGRLVEHPLPAREVRVQAVAELVRERQHVAAARRPVEQQVRVVRRHRVRAERARSLARACGRVDPRVVEELPRGVGELAARTSRRRRARAPALRSTRSCSRRRRSTPCGRSRRGGRCRAAAP